MFGQLIARLLGVAGIVVGSQAPNFTTQYMQNLTGRVAELGTIVAEYDQITTDLGVTREGYVDDLRAADRPSTDKTANVVETTYARYDRLSAHLATLKSAEPMRRPLVLGRDYERDIAESTLSELKPAIPLTADAAVYAIGTGGVLWGAPAALFGLIAGMFGMGRRHA
ncbi:MAG: DUF2937 family protein [Pseudomonadota bacterium]